ncbi:hypothetical protein [Shewanella frigidimarina]
MNEAAEELKTFIEHFPKSNKNSKITKS